MRTYLINHDNFEYEVKVIDSTHILIKVKNFLCKPCIWHTLQLPEWLKKALPIDAQGFITERM